MNIGIMNSLYDPEAIGQTYEAVGPERITMVRIKYTVRPNKNSGIGILKAFDVVKNQLVKRILKNN